MELQLCHGASPIWIGLLMPDCPHIRHIPCALTEQALCGADAAAVQAYVKSLKDYITKNGSTKVSELGAKVKKPAGLTTKLTKAINESGAFTINKSQDVSLK